MSELGILDAEFIDLEPLGADKAADALDPTAEAEVLAGLTGSGRTLMVMAHPLSADRVVSVGSGRIRRPSTAS
ncbi:hypothetical protein [Kitasatospora purpeofusca]|uniref:hypothetical protein n=1 Tax=Kitasatospora purpeofusca TaxID=67352 RepID=UPI002A59BF4F|nr:hypothetical protein [Kitasatospora purpeofusca]MDY0816522.1 hypothetical protein [Kitasatospora purpeofusca]